jgi:hypothetical protein
VESNRPDFTRPEKTGIIATQMFGWLTRRIKMGNGISGIGNGAPASLANHLLTDSPSVNSANANANANSTTESLSAKELRQLAKPLPRKRRQKPLMLLRWTRSKPKKLRR